MSEESTEHNSLREDVRRWCSERLGEAVGTDAVIRRTVSQSARVSSLWSLEVGIPGSGSKRVYLKQYPNPDAVCDMLRLFARVDEAARTRHDIRLPRLIGLDTRRGLVLTTECAGTPLLTAHRKWILHWLVDPRLAIKIWEGVGAFLKTLHSALIPPQMSSTHVPQLCAYTIERFDIWGREHRRHENIARSAIEAVDILARQLDGQMVPLVPCHGDVSAGNILIGETIGMVDFDDLRLDLAAVDLSQAILELEEFGHLGGVLFLKKLTKQLRTSLLQQYGLSHLAGPQFWLPHLRNLSVFLLTLARRKRSLFDPAIIRYGRTIEELCRAVQSIRDSSGMAPYWRTA